MRESALANLLDIGFGVEYLMYGRKKVLSKVIDSVFNTIANVKLLSNRKLIIPPFLYPQTKKNQIAIFSSPFRTYTVKLDDSFLPDEW